MVKIAIINESKEVYNLAVHKIENYHKLRGDTVFMSTRADAWSRACRKAYLSAIFTWDLPKLVNDARMLKDLGVEIEIGGPAATYMHDYVFNGTGVEPHHGIDMRFEHVQGEFQCTFTSRGCPGHNCEFCLVQTVEGRKMIEYDDFNIPVGKNPWMCDNNILSTSPRHQQLVVDKLSGVHNLDLNSGFDDRIFVHDPDKYWNLYRNLDLECWRFAYDQEEQKEPLTACVNFLHSQGVNYRKIIVFCLVGSEGQTFEEARLKLQYLIDIGCSPYPMRYKPLNSMDKSWTAKGWTDRELNLLFCFYGVPYKWRKGNWDEYVSGYVKNDPMQGKLSLPEINLRVD